jgi:hypothetical protein
MNDSRWLLTLKRREQRPRFPLSPEAFWTLRVAGGK